MSTPLRTRIALWLTRVLRVGRGPRETRSLDTIARQAHAEAHAAQKGMH